MSLLCHKVKKLTNLIAFLLLLLFSKNGESAQEKRTLGLDVIGRTYAVNQFVAETLIIEPINNSNELFKYAVEKKLFKFKKIGELIGLNSTSVASCVNLFSKPNSLKYNELIAQREKIQKEKNHSVILAEAPVFNDVKELSFTEEATSEIKVEVVSHENTEEIKEYKKGNLLTQKLKNNFDVSFPSSPIVDLVDSKREDNQVINLIFDKNARLEKGPSEISMGRVGDHANLNIEINDKKEKVSVFIRDKKILKWNEDKKSLLAVSEGKTEVYLYSQGKLHILPVSVGESSLSNLKIPSELMSLSELNAGGSKRLLASATNILQDDNALLADNHKILPSLDEVNRSSENKSELTALFNKNHSSMSQMSDQGFVETQIQVVDDRSVSEAVYPILGVNVELIGYDYKLKTNALGKTKNFEVPKGSRFLVKITDPLKRHQASMNIIRFDKRGLIRIKVLRQGLYELTSRLAGQTTDEQGSFCGVVNDSSGKPLEGSEVSIDWENYRAVYANSYGFVDPIQKVTSIFGRFCFVGVPSGPVAIYVKNNVNNTEHGPIPFNVFKGFHSETAINLDNKIKIQSSLVVAPTAFEQWNGGFIDERMWRPVNYAELKSLGGELTWQRSERHGFFESVQNQYQKSAYYLSSGAEFEEVLYRYNSEDSKAVTPLFPRGFLEDFAKLSGTNYNFLKGTVFIEHGFLKGESDLTGKAEILLIDQYNNEVGDQVSWDSKVSTKSLFYNVPAGTYAVLVRTANGSNIWHDEVLVYEETMSFLRTGSSLVPIIHSQ